jgi:hypothetical protein
VQKLLTKFVAQITYKLRGKNILKNRNNTRRINSLVKKPLTKPYTSIFDAKQQLRNDIGITIMFCKVLFVSLENPALTS